MVNPITAALYVLGVCGGACIVLALLTVILAGKPEGYNLNDYYHD